MVGIRSTDVEVHYREVRPGDRVLICRVAGDPITVVPAWMFDPATCGRMALELPQASIVALEECR